MSDDELHLSDRERALGIVIEQVLEPLKTLDRTVTDVGRQLPQLHADAEVLAVSIMGFLKRLRRQPEVKELLLKLSALRELRLTEDPIEPPEDPPEPDHEHVVVFEGSLYQPGTMQNGKSIKVEVCYGCLDVRLEEK